MRQKTKKPIKKQQAGGKRPAASPGKSRQKTGPAPQGRGRAAPQLAGRKARQSRAGGGLAEPQPAGLRRTKNKAPEGKAKGETGQPHHDSFVRDIYSKPKYALDLLRLTLPKKLFESLDQRTLRAEAASLFGKDGREKRTDLMFSARMEPSREEAGILFIFEHRSHQKADVYQQLLEYQTPLYRRRRPVITVLIHSGPKRKWKAPLDFQGSLKGLPPLFEGGLEKDRILNFRPFLLNAAELDLRGEAGRLTTCSILYILKNIYDLSEDVVEGFFRMSRGLADADRKFLVDRACLYIRQRDPRFTWRVLREIGSKFSKEGKVMPTSFLQHAITLEARKEAQEIAQEIAQKMAQKMAKRMAKEMAQEMAQKAAQKAKKQALQKGLQKGLQKVAANMLKKKFDIPAISKATGLPKKEILKLKNS